jgi:glycine/D-amino acid oxidase-like deaminating enzyme
MPHSTKSSRIAIGASPYSATRPWPPLKSANNGDFLIDFHPNMPNVLLVGGGSGHGFKHGPEVGRYASALLSSTAKIEPRFSLASKGGAQNREVH